MPSLPMEIILILGLSFSFLLISPATSLICDSQKLKTAGEKPYDRCLDLPVLGSYLHYTYNADNSSLSVAFVADLPRSDGWIAWAVNPTAEGMIGAQTLVAFVSNGSPVVKTYNISSYKDIKEGNLSFDVWNLRAETVTGGKLALLASVRVPEKSNTLNHVWQVGGKVTDGRLEKHEFATDNLNAKSKLTLMETPESPSPAQEPSGSVHPKPSGDTATKNRGTLGRDSNSGVYLLFLVLYGAFFVF